MSETTLTRIMDRRPAVYKDAAGLHQSGILLTVAERDALAAQLTEVTRELERWNKCDSLVCPYEQRALSAEAALAPLRAVVEIACNCVYAFTYLNEPDQAMWMKKLDLAILALPADPSAPTPEKE